MKRINLSVEVEDNEVLEESIKQALLGQARQIAREALEVELTSEIERITNSKINEVKQSQYWNSIATRITDIIIKRFGKDLTLNNQEINEMLENKVEEYLEKKMSSRGGLDNYIQSYIDKSIASALMKKANDEQ